MHAMTQRDKNWEARSFSSFLQSKEHFFFMMSMMKTANGKWDRQTASR